MKIDTRELFEGTFRSTYETFKAFTENQEQAAEKALDLAKIAVMESDVSEETMTQWSLEMFIKYKVNIDIPKVPVMREGKQEEWYTPKLISNSFYWPRYKEYLARIKQWPYETIISIDDSTNEIMKSLGDPNSKMPFDKRGLVLGYVQSGKTANFTGLINKAYDVGYKLIIVLSGIHNDLRAQTQLRLEEEVIGSNGGVSIISSNTSENIIGTLTSVEKDISSDTTGIRNLTNPNLLVVKKNKTVLESLISLLNYHKTLFDLDVPVLVIDDEADQASVDTSNPEKLEDPKTINSLIRQLLEVFKRKCYVGYTATPFANLLIGIDNATDHEGVDLYPKDFLVGLPKPADYCGPEEFFNIEEDAEDPRPSLIRELKAPDVDAFKLLKKKDDAEKFTEVPPQMREAILAFLLTISIRNLRGQIHKHNSMLIHTSRFKNVQSSIKDEVAKEFDSIFKELLYKENSRSYKELRELYFNDFKEVSYSWPEELPEFSWEEIFEDIKITAEKIMIFEVNGDSKDALDYHQYKERGLHVIAVGGDKLSRGLTLEGLSITYYLRNTAMYDTLMQMGRWFGYRKGYMDLCRIYTSSEIASNFEHLAIAMVELRAEFDLLSSLNKAPKEYALKMLSHPSMTLTSPLKMRNSMTANTNYNTTLQQTRTFDKEETFFTENMEATVKFLKIISNEIFESKRYFIAEKVSSKEIINYLSEYKTASKATKVDSRKISNYIKNSNEINELTEWTIAVVKGDSRDRARLGKFPVQLGDIILEYPVMRGREGNGDGDSVDIKAIVASGQEFFDLDKEQINLKDKKGTRSKRPMERGVMLIYPLHPGVEKFQLLNVNFNKNLIPIGLAFSFPGTKDEKIYEVNKTINEE